MPIRFLSGFELSYAIPGHYTKYGLASVFMRVIVMVARATLNQLTAVMPVLRTPDFGAELYFEVDHCFVIIFI